MSIAVGALYIRKYFNEASKQNALEMVNDIRYVIVKLIYLHKYRIFLTIIIISRN